MKKTKFSDEKIAHVLRQVEVGKPAVEVCREYGISEQTFYRWKKKYGGMGVVELRRLRQLEEENSKLKQLVADSSSWWLTCLWTSTCSKRCKPQEVITKKL